MKSTWQEQKSGPLRKNEEPAAVRRAAHSVCWGGHWKLFCPGWTEPWAGKVPRVFQLAEENNHGLLCRLSLCGQLRWFHVLPNLEWMFRRKYLAILFTLKLWSVRKVSSAALLLSNQSKQFKDCSLKGWCLKVWSCLLKNLSLSLIPHHPCLWSKLKLIKPLLVGYIIKGVSTLP